MVRPIDRLARNRGVQADPQWIHPGKPIVEQAAQRRIGRVLRDRIDARAVHDHKAYAFYIASGGFVDKYPALVARLNAVFASEGVWADAHHEEVAAAQAEATGVDIEAIRRFVDRSTNRVVPIDDEVINSQQAVADRFARLGLIPKPIVVSDIVWKEPNSASISQRVDPGRSGRISRRACLPEARHGDTGRRAGDRSLQHVEDVLDRERLAPQTTAPCIPGFQCSFVRRQNRVGINR
jgi:hypothetical protein